MTHVTCRLTAKNRDLLRNPTLGSQVWATFTFLCMYVQLTLPTAFCLTQGHTMGAALTGGLSGGSSDQVAAPASQQQLQQPGSLSDSGTSVCELELRQFVQCSQTRGDLSLCQGFSDALRDCRRAHGLSISAAVSYTMFCSVLQPSSIRGLATPWTDFVHFVINILLRTPRCALWLVNSMVTSCTRLGSFLYSVLRPSSKTYRYASP